MRRGTRRHHEKGGAPKGAPRKPVSGPNYSRLGAEDVAAGWFSAVMSCDMVIAKKPITMPTSRRIINLLGREA